MLSVAFVFAAATLLFFTQPQISVAGTKDLNSGQCPPGYDLTTLGGQARCITPPVRTYRPMQSCHVRDAFLVLDFYDTADRCVLADMPAGGPQVALIPVCKDSFSLEVKPGKDRCVREEREFSLPVQ